MKVRRREEGFTRRASSLKKSTKEVSGYENCQDQEGSPCGFPSQVAEPLVRAASIISHSVPSPGAFPLHAIVLYAGPGRSPAIWVICKNLFHWKHLHAEQRTGCKLRRLLVSDSAASMTLEVHFAESLNIERQSKNRLRISWLSPQT